MTDDAVTYWFQATRDNSGQLGICSNESFITPLFATSAFMTVGNISVMCCNLCYITLVHCLGLRCPLDFVNILMTFCS